MLKGGPLRHTFHPWVATLQWRAKEVEPRFSGSHPGKVVKAMEGGSKNHGDHGVWWVHVINCSNRWWVPLHFIIRISLLIRLCMIYTYIYNIYIYTMYIYIYLYDVRRFTNHHGLSVWYALIFDASCSVHVELAFLNIYFLFPQAIGQKHVLDGIDGIDM